MILIECWSVLSKIEGFHSTEIIQNRDITNRSFGRGSYTGIKQHQKSAVSAKAIYSSLQMTEEEAG